MPCTYMVGSWYLPPGGLDQATLTPPPLACGIIAPGKKKFDSEDCKDVSLTWQVYGLL